MVAVSGAWRPVGVRCGVRIDEAMLHETEALRVLAQVFPGCSNLPVAKPVRDRDIEYARHTLLQEGS